MAIVGLRGRIIEHRVYKTLKFGDREHTMQFMENFARKCILCCLHVVRPWKSTTSVRIIGGFLPKFPVDKFSFTWQISCFVFSLDIRDTEYSFGKRLSEEGHK